MLGAHNLFYYFDPQREGCPLTQADLVTGSYVIESSLDTPTVYPEYDRLIGDRRIDMVAIFGQIEHGELKSSDWGFHSYNSFSDSFVRRGFSVVSTFDNNSGRRLEKVYPGGLLVAIDLYTPVGFADSVPRAEASERFRSAMRTHEIVYYNGHAFYGSLDVLKDPSAYPEDTYQIYFMDACWSYAYYTKQVFAQRASEQDPDGYRLVDVVNNTEPGVTGSEATASALWDNIFKGAAAVQVGGDATIYSWNNLVKYMNDHAEARAAQRTTHKEPEIYGVSGVTTNSWQPSQANPEPDPTPLGISFESADELPIPDNSPAGAVSVIEVPEGTGQAGMATIEVSIVHSYIGDLTVTLNHAGRSLILHERSGGYTENLDIKLSTDVFSGLPADGRWLLVAVDGQSMDEGRILHWSIDL